MVCHRTRVARFVSQYLVNTDLKPAQNPAEYNNRVWVSV